MSRGRTPRSYPESRLTVRRAAEAALGRGTLVESLEERRLLTTLVGGQSYTYYDAGNRRIQITLSGSITAEFLAARISTTTRNGYTANGAVIRDLIPPPPPQNAPPGYQGADLFSIYVAEAGPDASIYISQVDQQGRLTPYAASAGSVRVNPVGRDPVEDPLFPISGPGVVYIGARTVNIIDNTTAEENIPITSVRNSQIFGVRPATRTIYAGLQTAAGVNLQNVFIGGTVTGIVNVEGSLGTFYAGSLLTGDARGLVGEAPSAVTNNFNIAGDLQQMYIGAGAAGAVGTNAANQFRFGTNVRVGGRIGYIHVAGNWMGQVQDRAVTDAPTISTPVVEAERYFPNTNAENAAFVNGQLTQAVTGTNATGIEDAQFTYSDTAGGMAWDGELQNTNGFGDTVDRYNLPLMAGQTTTIELITSFTSEDGLTSFSASAYLQLLDPTGRVVASDLPGPGNTANLLTTNQRFQYTAEMPGVYTLAVTAYTNGAGTYRLLANSAGFVPVGGASIGGTTRFLEPGNGVALRRGDLGAWLGTGAISGDVTTDGAGNELGFDGSPIVLSKGNLRAFYGAGALDGVNLIIPRGSVGHMRSGGNMRVNPASIALDNSPDPDFAIGGDLQRVEAGGNLAGGVIANGRIGTIVAGTIQAVANQGVAVIAANADDRGSDGTVDMIYATGDFGLVNGGGPRIYSGLGGNIKYIFVGGTIFRDPLFGGTILAQTFLEAGRSINFVDDSGARASIRPTNTVTTSAAPAGSVPGTTVDPITGATTVISFAPNGTGLIQTVTAPGSLDYQAYGIRGVGGQVMINLHSTTSLDVVSQTRGSIEFGNIDIDASGSAPVVGTLGLEDDSDGDGFPDVLIDINRGVTTTVGYPTDDTTTPPTDPNNPTAGEGFTTVAPNPNELNFYGPARVDVFHVVGANITSLNNFTGGEIVSVDADNLGIINARRVGLSDTAMAGGLVVPGNMGATAPFDAFSRGINVGGPMISVLARDGLGNVASASTINTINPNSDGKNARGVNDGINGAIRAGVMNVVQIGEGIAFGGSGDVFRTGLYATDTINNVVGNEADIRGPIVANNYINSIVLTNGSIIKARVGTLGAFDQALYTASTFALQDPPSNLGFALNQLLIRGNGGVIGSDLQFGNFANITVEGFGIINSYIGAIAASNINGQIVTNGFGIRSSVIDVGSSVRTITAAGNGRVLSTADYSNRANQSGGPRKLRFDPYSGRVLDGTNDLNRYFGTSRTTPRRSGATNAGVVAETSIVGDGTLGTLNAYAYTTSELETPTSSPTFQNAISFASNIGTINITRTISGLNLRTGKLDNMTVGNDIQRADIRVAGEIGDINVGGTVRGTTLIRAQNVNGQIGSIVVKGGLYGEIRSENEIGTIAADVIAATIAAGDDINRISTNGSILTGAYIRSARNINRVVIGGDFENDALIQARDVKVFRVAGENLGDLDETA